MARSTPPAFHYPKPETKLSVPTIHPRKLEPIKPPAPRKSVLVAEARVLDNRVVPFADSGFIRSTHVIPAATPRVLSFELSEEELPADKEARQRRVQGLSRALLSKKQALERGEGIPGLVAGDDEKAPILFNVLDRYARASPTPQKGKGLTVVLAHANGFPRRIWEPFLMTLLKNFEKERKEEGLYIEEAWSFETVNHGDSALLNDGKLGDTFSWADNARDILNFLLHFLPSNPQEAGLSEELDSISLDESSRRSRFGFRKRKLVGIGHSLGGCSMARAAIDFPSLFSSLVLVDPVIMPALDKDPSGGIEKLQTGAVARRSRWSSREEALESFRKTPFFQVWNPAALETYVTEGIVSDPAGGVKLKQSGFHEASVFAERRVPVETWELLAALHEKVHLFWAMSGRKPVVTGPEEVTCQTVWRRPKNSSNIRIEGAGHLIVHEAPEQLAQAISDHLWTRFTEDEPPIARL
ncbi:hypothetical protein FS837_002418 [Tulasnella sp. UAMH 9824]|nr:hypothetical protein FS837_002418 [Tulasnella sp. UAMH 9824]